MLELHPCPHDGRGQASDVSVLKRSHDLKSLMRNSATEEQLIEVISSVWPQRTDLYSDERLAAMNSPEGYQPESHHKIEMLTLGR